MINQEVLKGKWKQARGRIKEKWGDLTNDELDKIDGSYDRLVGTIQEKYGYSKEDARTNVNNFLQNMEEKPSKH